jgi:hypothetical protein
MPGAYRRHKARKNGKENRVGERAMNLTASHSEQCCEQIDIGYHSTTRSGY